MAVANGADIGGATVCLQLAAFKLLEEVV